MSKHVVFVAGGLMAIVLVVAAQAQTPAQGEIYGRSAKLQFQPFRAPTGRFSLEYPKKDWQIVPGGGSVMMTFAQKKSEAAVVIEHTVLKMALAPEEITDLFAQLEVDTIKERHPTAANFLPRVFNAGNRKLIIVQFTRPGLNGQDLVRQYSIPSGQDLYRLICSAQVAQFPKYAAVFAHMAASFTIVSGTE